MSSLSADLQQQMSKHMSAAIEAVEALYDPIDATALALLLRGSAANAVAVIDVRDEEAFGDAAAVRITGSINVPHHTLLTDVSAVKALVDGGATQIVFVSYASPDLDAAAAGLWADALHEEAGEGKDTSKYSAAAVRILLGGLGTWVELHGDDESLTTTPTKTA